MADLTIAARDEGDTTHLVLTGEFDLAGIQRFQDAIAKVEQANPKTIVVDLGGLEFMDSSGLRALVTSDRRSRAAGRRFAIVPGPPQVRRVFEITQLEQRLELLEDPGSL